MSRCWRNRRTGRRRGLWGWGGSSSSDFAAAAAGGGGASWRRRCWSRRGRRVVRNPGREDLPGTQIDGGGERESH